MGKVVVQWEIASEETVNPDKIQKFLVSGWEPFAVAPGNHWDSIYFRRPKVIVND